MNTNFCFNCIPTAIIIDLPNIKNNEITKQISKFWYNKRIARTRYLLFRRTLTHWSPCMSSSFNILDSPRGSISQANRNYAFSWFMRLHIRSLCISNAEINVKVLANPELMLTVFSIRRNLTSSGDIFFYLVIHLNLSSFYRDIFWHIICLFNKKCECVCACLENSHFGCCLTFWRCSLYFFNRISSYH